MFVNEIFESINGEVNILGQGSLCTFIRLQGCNCQCTYCDTVSSQKKFISEKTKIMDFSEIVEEVEKLGNKNVTITGGEPLLQREDLRKLSIDLAKRNFIVSIETNGTFIIPDWYFVNWVSDWKAPSSGHRDMMDENKLLILGPKDFIKFVVSSYEDFKDAEQMMQTLCNIKDACVQPYPNFAFSPVMNAGYSIQEESHNIIKLMQTSYICKKTSAIFNLQIHKIIGIS